MAWCKSRGQGKRISWLISVHFCFLLSHNVIIISELFINPKRSSQREVISHRWTKGNTLSFETSSNSGHPKTLSLKISTTSRNVDTRDDISGEEDMGCAFVDLTPLWNQTNQTSNQSTTSSRVFLFDERGELFDQHGLPERPIHDDEVRLHGVLSVRFVSTAHRLLFLED